MFINKKSVSVLIVILLFVFLTACGESTETCYVCGGGGYDECTVKIGARVLGNYHGYDCPVCNGTDKVICRKCDGSGTIPKE